MNTVINLLRNFWNALGLIGVVGQGDDVQDG